MFSFVIFYYNLRHSSGQLGMPNGKNKTKQKHQDPEDDIEQEGETSADLEEQQQPVVWCYPYKES